MLNSHLSIITLFFFKSIIKSCSGLVQAIYAAVLMLMILVFSLPNECLGSSGVLLGSVLNITVLSSYFLLDIAVHKPMREGWLRALYTSGLERFYVILPQFIVLTLCMILLSAIILTASIIMIPRDGYDVALLLATLSLTAPLFASILLLIGLITAGGRYMVMQYILSVPLILPVIICACGSIEYSYFYTILLGMNMVYLPIFLLLSCICVGAVI
jgi:ABC-type transport system involved in cytochrome c biogenesis permease component